MIINAINLLPHIIRQFFVDLEMVKQISVWTSRVDMEYANTYEIDSLIKTKEIKD